MNVSVTSAPYKFRRQVWDSFVRNDVTFLHLLVVLGFVD